MASHKESSTNFITPEIFGEIIYENYLFDIPRLLDMCALYGTSENLPLLNKMVENIFKQQNKYHDDLHQAAKTVVQVKPIEDIINFRRSH